MQFCNKFTYHFVYIYAIIICLFSFDTLQVLVFVCPSISELRFYGCFHPCLFVSILTNMKHSAAVPILTKFNQLWIVFKEKAEITEYLFLGIKLIGYACKKFLFMRRLLHTRSNIYHYKQPIHSFKS